MQVKPKKKKMKPDELEKAFVLLNWSNKEAAEELGIGERRIYYLLKGQREIPSYVSKTILLHIKMKEIQEILNKRA